MAQAAFKVHASLPKNRVLGMAGVLDSATVSTFVAEGALNVSLLRNVHWFRPGRARRRHGAADAVFDSCRNSTPDCCRKTSSMQ